MSCSPPLLAVVIPSCKIRTHIHSELGRISPKADLIYVANDTCTGFFVEENTIDPRVRAI